MSLTEKQELEKKLQEAREAHSKTHHAFRLAQLKYELQVAEEMYDYAVKHYREAGKMYWKRKVFEIKEMLKECLKDSEKQ